MIVKCLQRYEYFKNNIENINIQPYIKYIAIYYHLILQVQYNDKDGKFNQDSELYELTCEEMKTDFTAGYFVFEGIMINLSTMSHDVRQVMCMFILLLFNFQNDKVIHL